MNYSDTYVCIIEDDLSVREGLEGLLKSATINVDTFGSAKEFLDRGGKQAPGCLLLDVELPGLSGMELQAELVSREINLPIIFLTGHGNIELCVQAMKAGALEFFTKPFDPELLLQAVERVLSANQIRQQAATNYMHHHGIVGTSAGLRKVLRQIDLVSGTDATVLITGESGTGKELVARAIHESSLRSAQSLVTVNCSAIPETLFESEFFGHVKGAFTGALRDKPGRFELANEGTLFLDEISEIPLGLQSKLLRVLQEQEIERLGDTRSHKLNVRIIAATNRNLDQEIAAGRFRSDLYYRLGVFIIDIPPLRERREDIPLLAEYFLRNSAERLKRPVPELTETSVNTLLRYDWPGNIRELQNAIERAIILSGGGPLEFSQVLGDARTTLERHISEEPSTLLLTRDELRMRERESIIAALDLTGGKVSGSDGAAALLGMKRTTLNSRILALGLRAKAYHQTDSRVA
jgi:DNA-binding NtrC family response regulator